MPEVGGNNSIRRGGGTPAPTLERDQLLPTRPRQPILEVIGDNLGSGAPVLNNVIGGTNDVLLEFKTIVGGSNITVTDHGAVIRIASPGGGGTVVVNGLSAFCAGIPGPDEIVGGGIAPVAFSISPLDSAARAVQAATGETIFTILRNGSAIGTVRFAPGQTVGEISITNAAIAIGDHLTIAAPAVADQTLSDLSFLLRS